MHEQEYFAHLLMSISELCISKHPDLRALSLTERLEYLELHRLTSLTWYFVGQHQELPALGSSGLSG